MQSLEDKVPKKKKKSKDEDNDERIDTKMRCFVSCLSQKPMDMAKKEREEKQDGFFFFVCFF